MNRRLLLHLLSVALLTFSGCSSYSDFQLPSPQGPVREVSYELQLEPEPVLDRAPAGQWDSVDVLNPAVTKAAGAYFNFYSGFDGKTWHTGRAVSRNGLTWEKTGKVLSPDPESWEGDYIAANGAVLHRGGEFLYWYQAGSPPQIGLARSRDGLTFEKTGKPVLGTGPRGSWDERGTADPYVIHASGMYYMFYLGMDRARRQRLGIARSANGLTWSKLRANPVLELGEAGEFDENGLGEPAVWSAHGRYWMIYTGRDRAEVRRLGLASSIDGVHWTKLRDAVWSGDQPWNSKVLCDPEVEVRGEEVAVWFGGGDQPKPDERLNGAIGFGILRPATIRGNELR